MSYYFYLFTSIVLTEKGIHKNDNIKNDSILQEMLVVTLSTISHLLPARDSVCHGLYRPSRGYHEFNREEKYSMFHSGIRDITATTFIKIDFVGFGGVIQMAQG